MKKILLILFTVCFLTVLTVACAGEDVTAPVSANAGIVPPIGEIDPDEGLPEEGDSGDDLVIDEDVDRPGQDGEDELNTGIAEYFSVTGIIISIEERDGLKRIEIEDADGNPAILVLHDYTVFPFSTDFAVGDEVTGWYLTNRPMIMIWPPEYSIDVLASRMGDDRNIKVDRFSLWDGDSIEQLMISQDGMFAFLVNSDTEIILEDGWDFSDGSLENRLIIVIYGMSTRSIPEQATADKLIVMFEDAVSYG